MATTTIKYWQQSNTITVTLRGHDASVPLPAESVTESEVIAAQGTDVTSDLTTYLSKIDGNTNYNTLYDSFFAPADFKFSAITLRLQEQLPVGVEYKISIKVNGAEIELLPIPEMEDHNQKTYSSGCDLHIWEDDFIEIDVQIESGAWSLLTWNNHNVTAAIAGCCWYEEYQTAFPEGTKEWTLGDNYYKTNVTLQNRSGNDIFKNRIFADIAKSPVSFLLQAVRLSMFEDELMTDDKLPRMGNCFYVDILANGRSVNRIMGIPQPTSLDSLNDNLRSYNSVHNDKQGFPILVGDDILIRIYQKNVTARYNSKILEVIAIGCASDCVTLIAEPVSVYELCTTDPCVAKFTITKSCDTVKTKKDPAVVCEEPIIP